MNRSSRWLDFALALVMLLISAPIILLAMVLVRLNSRGPSIYTQKRLGLGGKVFTIYKIRTMYQDSERDCGPTGPSPVIPGSRRSAGSCAGATWMSFPSSSIS